MFIHFSEVYYLISTQPFHACSPGETVSMLLQFPWNPEVLSSVNTMANTLYGECGEYALSTVAL